MSPFGPYDDFNQCVTQNSDKASPEGFCAWLHHQIIGTWPSQSAEMPAEAWEIYRQVYSEQMEGNTKPIKEAEQQANDHAIRKLNEGGWFLSRIGWVKQYASPKMRTVANVRVFASGIWTDSAGVNREWKDEDLDGLVQAFNMGIPGIVPLKAGHTPDSFNRKIAEKLGVPVDVVTGDPTGRGQISIGRMATLERRGSLLFGTFERVPDAIAELIDTGLYSTVSVEIEDEVGGFSSTITAVALLGAEEPAVDEATLDRALVFGGKRDKAHVLTFKKQSLPPDVLRSEWKRLQARMGDVIKGLRGAPFFRGMMTEMGTLFDRMIKQKGEHQNENEGTSMQNILPEISELAKREYQGNIQALINWVRTVGFDACVASLTGTEGITDPVLVCGWLKGQAQSAQKGGQTMGDTLKSLSLKELAAKYQISEEELMALATALGLGEGATLEDIIAAIEALKVKAGAAPQGEAGAMAQNFQKMTSELSKANTKIADLERKDRVHGYLEQTRLFTAIPRKSDEMAVELAEMEEKQGKGSADKMLQTYSELNKMGEEALKVRGTSRGGTKQADFEVKVSEYQKANPDTTRSQAVKAVMKAEPTLYEEYKVETEAES